MADVKPPTTKVACFRRGQRPHAPFRGAECLSTIQPELRTFQLTPSAPHSGDDENMLTVCAYPVDPKTVGQYTGKDDVNGEHVFCHDIMNLHSHAVQWLLWKWYLLWS